MMQAKNDNFHIKMLYYYRKQCHFYRNQYMSKTTVSTDHKGITYNSLKEMCDAYNISVTLYLKRIERGWTVKDALEGKEPFYSRDGKDYSSQKEVCDEFNIHRNTFRDKLSRGYTIDEIIDGVTYRIEDHLGNRYPTMAEMCAAYQIKVATYRSRIGKGMSKEEALTKKVDTKD